MPKTKPLVTQHLEKVSREAIAKYPAVLWEFTRKRNGIYVLYRKGKIYYVGLASNLRSRLKAHLTDRFGCLKSVEATSTKQH